MRKTLIDLVAAAMDRDPRDAPTVYLEADIMADDMERYAPTAAEPVTAGRSGSPTSTTLRRAVRGR